MRSRTFVGVRYVSEGGAGEGEGEGEGFVEVQGGAAGAEVGDRLPGHGEYRATVGESLGSPFSVIPPGYNCT